MKKGVRFSMNGGDEIFCIESLTLTVEKSCL